MAKLTNKHNLPDIVARTLSLDKYSRGNSDLSITELIDSTQVRLLKWFYKSKVENDVVDFVWTKLGSWIHYFFEEANKDNNKVLCEERMFIDVGGYRLSGQFDIYDIDSGTMYDIKVSSVWSAIFDIKESWIKQLNCYAYMMMKTMDIKVKKLQILLIARDWSEAQSRNKPDYPKIPVVLIDIPLWDVKKTEAYIEERALAHKEAEELFKARMALESSFEDQSKELKATIKKHGIEKIQEFELPLCTDDEVWRRDTKWALMKKNRKSAVKLFTSEEEAEKRLVSENSKQFYIEHRKGEAIRCERYCNIQPFCNQYQQEKKDG